MASRDTFFKKHRIYLVMSNTLCWWGSYQRRGNALLYLKESGSGLRAMQTEVEPGKFIWHVQENGVLRDATVVESSQLISMPVRFPGIN